MIHIYKYNTHAEQRFFFGGKQRINYDLVALNGNIVSHTPAGVAAFLATINKPFYIDPQTHAFQHALENLKRDVSDPEKGEPQRLEFKPSIEVLAKEHLKGPFARVIERDEPINPNDFYEATGNINSKVLNEVCESTINFQLNTIRNSLKPEDIEFIENQDFPPHFIIAPYFFISSKNIDNWIKINIACYKKSVQVAKDHEVFINLVISKELLSIARDRILDSLSTLKPNGVILWIDNNEEEKLSQHEIEEFISFIRALRNLTGTLYNSHGGYLSILLCHPGFNELLNGVGHSINYGESRNVIPVGGGLPMARFYLFSIHSRLRYADAVDIIRSMGWLDSIESYFENVCDCQQCRKIISEHVSIDDAFLFYGESFTKRFVRRDRISVSREYPTAEAKQAAAWHYLFNKAKEFNYISKVKLNDLLTEINSTFQRVSEIRGGFDSIIHLRKWHTALSKLLI